MKRRLAGGSLFLGGVLLALIVGQWLGRTGGALAMVAGILVWRSHGDAGALLRWDHFLPFRNRRWRRQGPDSSLVRLSKRVLPTSWFFNEETGKEGKLRRWCRKLGPTVLSAPWRRLVQALCFVLFAVLFFYVCWPYGARPESEGEVSEAWELVGIDQETGRVNVRSSAEAPPWLKAGGQVYVSQGANSSRAEVVRMDGNSILLEPEAPQVFLLATGLWTLSEKPVSQWPSHYTDHLERREKIPADVFLMIDPLVSLSTAVAARSWVWSLICAAVILIVCVLIPRGFCGYVCPLGSLIDLFDWAVSKRVKRFRVPANGWWVHVKYYLLVLVMLAAVGGVLLSGFVAAIPVITRGFLFIGEPLQSGVLRGWHLVPAMNAGQWFSIALFVAVLLLGLLKPRFWCRYVCPSGAVFSLGNFFRLSERKVESSCIHCNKCVTVCPFDAIKPDFTTRTSDCTLCQTCGGVCPTHAIKFVERWNTVDLKPVNDPPTGETAIGRRSFVSWAAGTTAAVAGGGLATWGTKSWGANLKDPGAYRPVRPPGSVPEEEFLQMCIRCGECFKACPNNVLQPQGFAQGLEGLWTPAMNADWAGCESSCNACGQVCPTGAIRALPLEEKKAARMGLAVVREDTCLPFAGREACQLCVDECVAAGYDAIEFTRVHTEVDADGKPVAGSGYLAPVVVPDKCVGCGLCQTRCYGINAEEKGLLGASAIVIEAGPGKEDRLMAGSYIKPPPAPVSDPLPDPFDAGDDPFGL